MRLIDADKIEYMWKQDINGKFHDGVTLESIVNNTPTVNVNDLIVKEFEKIKTEIELTKCNKGCLPRIIAECNISKSNREWCEYYYFLKIINEHISELKGETE